MTHDPWLTDDNDFPSHGSNADKLRFLLHYAVLAPSSHNTQPWLFRVAVDSVDLLADSTRCLLVVDPHDRALVIRVFDLGGGVAAKDQQIAAGSPALAVLSTPDDTPQAWLATGQALSRVLLTATAAGVSAAFLNQPIEIESLRLRLGESSLNDAMGIPQLLFRMGYGPPLDPAIRGPLDDVILNG